MENVVKWIMRYMWIVALASVLFEIVSATTSDVGGYTPTYDDLCTNECSETDPRYWCGEHKEDSGGRVMRCVQYTRYGEVCVAECGGKEKKYNWCITNDVKIGTGVGQGHWWEYCSLVGYTIKKAPCKDDCGLRGENYFWCHTDDTLSAWDYCSPPGLVKPVQYTVRGDECISECRQHGKNYHWCTKSLDYCTEDSCDWDWDYCSLDGDHTRYNYKCKEKCDKKGTSYYWCNQEGGSWDYCSPSPKLGVHKSDHVELTRYGVKCRDVCSLKGENYYWCSQHGGDNQNWWDYCSPQSDTTINQGKCKDECEMRGSSYFWCNTESSWDYCSPKYVPGEFQGHETVDGVNKFKLGLIMGLAFFGFFIGLTCLWTCFSRISRQN